MRLDWDLTSISFHTLRQMLHRVARGWGSNTKGLLNLEVTVRRYV